MLNTQSQEHGGAQHTVAGAEWCCTSLPLGFLQKLAAFPSLAETSQLVLGQKTFPGRFLLVTP